MTKYHAKQTNVTAHDALDLHELLGNVGIERLLIASKSGVGTQRGYRTINETSVHPMRCVGKQGITRESCTRNSRVPFSTHP